MVVNAGLMEQIEESNSKVYYFIQYINLFDG